MLLAPVRLKNLIFLTGGRMFMRKLCYFHSKGFELAGSGSWAYIHFSIVPLYIRPVHKLRERRRTTVHFILW